MINFAALFQELKLSTWSTQGTQGNRNFSHRWEKPRVGSSSKGWMDDKEINGFGWVKNKNNIVPEVNLYDYLKRKYWIGIYNVSV